MPSAGQITPGRPAQANGGRAPWRRFYVALCALSLLGLFLTGCTVNLNSPVTLANTPAHGVTVPAEIRHGDRGATLVVVDVMIHGKGPYQMALDTGASLTLIDRPLALQLGLTVAGPPEDITGVGGQQRVTPVTISKWSVGQAQFPAMTITSAPLSDLKNSAGVDGLLGSDVLDRYGAVTIDYTDSQVTFYQIAPGGSSSGASSN
ncbi:MAG TPA: retropepsin-like aspartic protease [Ktedonobacterales bacterium]